MPDPCPAGWPACEVEERKFLPTPSVMIATSPNFRKVLHLNGLKRNCLVRSIAGETASTAEMGCIGVLSREATAYYRITQFLSVKFPPRITQSLSGKFHCPVPHHRPPTLKRLERPLAHHPVPLLFVA